MVTQDKKSTSLWTVILVTILVSFIVSIITYKFVGPQLDELLKKQIEVPNVCNLELEHAKLILGSKRLQVQIQGEVFNNEIPAGKIANQNPLPGIVVKEGTTVALFVSKGKEKVTVPILNFLTAGDAENQLTAVGLILGKIEYTESTAVPKDRIISSDPIGGSEVDKGTVVNVTVSAGAPPKAKPKVVIPKVTVPDLTDKTVQEALEILSSKGLILGKIYKRTDITKEFDIILNQNPPAGSSINKGSAVEVTVNAEAESAE
ncbi:MAG: PASTA domain-containing protein [Elusimicrobiota bacterium]|nr:PASTA domain-containing protein [Elusimicrobiota bacterium]